MAITFKHVNPAGTRTFMGTLTNHIPIHTALAQVAQQNNILTATFELLGGLSEVEFTAYDFVSQTRLEALVFTRPVEIIAGHGTISQLDHQPHIHLHLAVSFRDPQAPHGISVVGGHTAHAHAFAVEFTLTAYDGNPIHRAPHPTTGLKLWSPH